MADDVLKKFQPGTRRFPPSTRTPEDAIRDSLKKPIATQSAFYTRRKRTKADDAFERRKYPGVFE